MKIGLVRHFKVDCPHKGLYSGDQFDKWSYDYDYSEVFKKDVDLKGIKWDKCYSSDLKRALETAQYAYKGDITISPLLREVPANKFTDKNIMMPVDLWLLMARKSWRKSSKFQKETYYDTMKRIDEIFTEIVENNLDTLVVCHGFLILQIRKYLISKGFKGDRIIKAQNGKMYLFYKE